MQVGGSVFGHHPMDIGAAGGDTGAGRDEWDNARDGTTLGGGGKSDERSAAFRFGRASDKIDLTTEAGVEHKAERIGEDLAGQVDPERGIDRYHPVVLGNDEGIVGVIENLADNGMRVLVTGLDMNFRGEPFGCIPVLLSKADKVDKLQAICMVCGEPATRTQRLVNGKPARFDDPVVIVGASEMYEARCRTHHEVPKD